MESPLNRPPCPDIGLCTVTEVGPNTYSANCDGQIERCELRGCTCGVALGLGVTLTVDFAARTAQGAGFGITCNYTF
jgi:hypothetical protein